MAIIIIIPIIISMCLVSYALIGVIDTIRFITYPIDKTILGLWYLVDKENLRQFMFKRMWRDLGEYKVVERYDRFELYRRCYIPGGILLGEIPETFWENNGWVFIQSSKSVTSLREYVLEERLDLAKMIRKEKEIKKLSSIQKSVSIWDDKQFKDEIKEPEEIPVADPHINDDYEKQYITVDPPFTIEITETPKFKIKNCTKKYKNTKEQEEAYHEWIVNEANKYM